MGYSVDSLLAEIRKILRTQGQHNIALVGAGRLGAAIASSPIFASTGSPSPLYSTETSPRWAHLLGGVPVSRSTTSTRSCTSAASSSVCSPFRPSRRRTRPTASSRPASRSSSTTPSADRHALPTSRCTRRTRPSSSSTRSTSTSRRHQHWHARGSSRSTPEWPRQEHPKRGCIALESDPRNETTRGVAGAERERHGAGRRCQGDGSQRCQRPTQAVAEEGGGCLHLAWIVVALHALPQDQLSVGRRPASAPTADRPPPDRGGTRPTPPGRADSQATPRAAPGQAADSRARATPLQRHERRAATTATRTTSRRRKTRRRQHASGRARRARAARHDQGTTIGQGPGNSESIRRTERGWGGNTNTAGRERRAAATDRQGQENRGGGGVRTPASAGAGTDAQSDRVPGRAGGCDRLAAQQVGPPGMAAGGRIKKEHRVIALERGSAAGERRRGRSAGGCLEHGRDRERSEPASTATNSASGTEERVERRARSRRGERLGGAVGNTGAVRASFARGRRPRDRATTPRPSPTRVRPASGTRSPSRTAYATRPSRFASRAPGSAAQVSQVNERGETPTGRTAQSP